MSHHDRALVVGALAVVVLAGIGAAVHVVPWLRDNRTDISLILLMLLLVASGFTAALALIIPYADRPTPADDLDGDDDNADDRRRRYRPGLPAVRGLAPPNPKVHHRGRGAAVRLLPRPHRPVHPYPREGTLTMTTPATPTTNSHNSRDHRGCRR